MNDDETRFADRLSHAAAHAACHRGAGPEMQLVVIGYEPSTGRIGGITTSLDRASVIGWIDIVRKRMANGEAEMVALNDVTQKPKGGN